MKYMIRLGHTYWGIDGSGQCFTGRDCAIRYETIQSANAQYWYLVSRGHADCKLVRVVTKPGAQTLKEENAKLRQEIEELTKLLDAERLSNSKLSQAIGRVTVKNERMLSALRRIESRVADEISADNRRENRAIGTFSSGFLSELFTDAALEVFMATDNEDGAKSG